MSGGIPCLKTREAHGFDSKLKSMLLGFSGPRGGQTRKKQIISKTKNIGGTNPHGFRCLVFGVLGVFFAKCSRKACSPGAP